MRRKAVFDKYSQTRMYAIKYILSHNHAAVKLFRKIGTERILEKQALPIFRNKYCETFTNFI